MDERCDSILTHSMRDVEVKHMSCGSTAWDASDRSDIVSMCLTSFDRRVMAMLTRS